MSRAHPQPIDAVYTWVDGSEPEYAQIRDDWAGRCGVPVNPERDRDEIPFLKYSLRSLERFAPWVRNVYIVTARPQAPDWLDRSHPRIRLVHHDEFFAFQEVLPTYNSNAIDWNLHLLPELSPVYWHFNDDYLLGRNVKRSHLLNKEGKMRVYLSKSLIPTPQTHDTLDAWASILHSTGKLLDEEFGLRPRAKHEHTPMLLPKTVFKLEGETRDTVFHRFREDSDIALETYLSHLLLERDLGVKVSAWEFSFATAFHRLDNDMKALKRSLRGIRLKRPRFYCLNDDLGSSPDPAYVRRVKGFLESYYPDKSSFEV